MDELPMGRPVTRRSFLTQLFAVSVTGGTLVSSVLAWAWPNLATGADEPLGLQEAGPLYREARFVLGTIVEVTVDHPHRTTARRAAREALAEITRVDHLLSIFRNNSEISRLNRGAGRWPVQVTHEVVRLLAFAQEVWERTAGAFDPTIFALMEGWGWYRPRPGPPSSEEVAAMREAVGFGTITIDPGRRQVHLHRPGVRIDLGGIGKGYAMDCAIAVLRRMGIQRALINAGGEIYALGDGDRTAPFPVAVFTPSQRVRIDKPFPLKGAAVASSGNDERSIRWEDLTIGHLFDPRTGYPVTAVEGASVLAPTATAADAYSTAVFVLGPQAGARLIEETPGLEGLIVEHLGAGGRKVPWRSRNWPTPKRV